MKSSLLRKRIVAGVMAFCLVGAMILPGSVNTAKAADTKLEMTSLENGKTIKCDLDGDGKKESIKYKCAQVAGEYASKATFYINGKKSKTIRIDQVEDPSDVTVAIVDLKSGDRKKEIFVKGTNEYVEATYFNFLRYKESGQKLNEMMKQSDFNLHGTLNWGVTDLYKKKDGKFSVYTTRHLPVITCMMEISMQLKGDKVVVSKSDLHKLDSSIYVDGPMCDLRLCKAQNVYKNVSGGKKLYTVSKGTKVVPIAVNDKSQEKCDLRVKILTGKHKGDKVWIRNVKGPGNQFFVKPLEVD